LSNEGARAAVFRQDRKAFGKTRPLVFGQHTSRVENRRDAVQRSAGQAAEVRALRLTSLP
jgi:hypothetical protein